MKLAQICILILGFVGQAMARRHHHLKWRKYRYHWPVAMDILHYETKPTSNTSLPMFCLDVTMDTEFLLAKINYDHADLAGEAKRSHVEADLIRRLIVIDRQLRCSALGLNVIGPDYNRGWDGTPDWYKRLNLRMSKIHKDHSVYRWTDELMSHRDDITDWFGRNSLISVEELKHIGETGAEDFEKYYLMLLEGDTGTGNGTASPGQGRS